MLLDQTVRRSLANLARGGQAPLEQIQLALGHQNIQQTVNIYGKWLPHAKRYVDGLRLWQQTATKTAGKAS